MGEAHYSAEEASMKQRVTGLASSLSSAESRLSAADTETRSRIEERVKEEVAWVLAVVKPLHQSIDKLAWGFHDLGMSHVKCSLEFDILEQVVKEVESRAMPWRSGLNGESLRQARMALPRSLQEGGQLSLQNSRGPSPAPSTHFSSALRPISPKSQMSTASPRNAHRSRQGSKSRPISSYSDKRS